MRQITPQEYIKLFGALYAFAPVDLSVVQVPTLLLNGEHESASVYRHAHELQRRIPHAEMATIPDAGHLCNLDNPAAFTEVVRDFLLRHSTQTETATCAFNLGHAYKDLPALRDLSQTEQWYRRSLELPAEDDRLGRGKTLAQLGYVAWEQFNEAQQAGEPQAVLLEHLNAALHAYQQARTMVPLDEVDSLAVYHNVLRNIYRLDIEHGLRNELPADLHDRVPRLAQVLAAVIDGTLSEKGAQEELQRPALAPLLRALAGTYVTYDDENGTIEFGDAAQGEDAEIIMNWGAGIRVIALDGM
jgi:hypothetical protein